MRIYDEEHEEMEVAEELSLCVGAGRRKVTLKKASKVLTLWGTAPWLSEFAQLLIFKYLIFMFFMVIFCF